MVSDLPVSHWHERFLTVPFVHSPFTNEQLLGWANSLEALADRLLLIKKTEAEVEMDVNNTTIKADEAAKARIDAERVADEARLRLLQAQSLTPMVCMLSVHVYCACS
jgi:hypothetical protein